MLSFFVLAVLSFLFVASSRETESEQFCSNTTKTREYVDLAGWLAGLPVLGLDRSLFVHSALCSRSRLLMAVAIKVVLL